MAGKSRNDPHNPERLMDRKRDSKGDGFDQDPSGWNPTKWSDRGAGKGDTARPVKMTHQEWGLRYDLAIGKITKEEFSKQMEELDS